MMAQRQVLEGDGRRPEEQGADECPERHHEYHRGTPASRHWSLSRDPTGSAVDAVRKVWWDKWMGFVTGTGWKFNADERDRVSRRHNVVSAMLEHYYAKTQPAFRLAPREAVTSECRVRRPGGSRRP